MRRRLNHEDQQYYLPQHRLKEMRGVCQGEEETLTVSGLAALRKLPFLVLLTLRLGSATIWTFGQPLLLTSPDPQMMVEFIVLYIKMFQLIKSSVVHLFGKPL